MVDALRLVDMVRLCSGFGSALAVQNVLLAHEQFYHTFHGSANEKISVTF